MQGYTVRIEAPVDVTPGELEQIIRSAVTTATKVTVEESANVEKDD